MKMTQTGSCSDIQKVTRPVLALLFSVVSVETKVTNLGWAAVCHVFHLSIQNLHFVQLHTYL